MVKFNLMAQLVKQAFNGRAIKRALVNMGLPVPAIVTDMYLSGESGEYIIAASLAIAQIGE